MWKVSGTEEPRRVVRRISKPSACQSDFLWHGILFFWESKADSWADMHTSRSTNRAQDRQETTNTVRRNGGKTGQKNNNNTTDIHVNTQTNSSQRQTDTGADHQIGSFIKQTVKLKTVFWMTLTIFPSIGAFVQKVTDYDEWTISLRKEKKKGYSYVLRNKLQTTFLYVYKDKV